MAVRPESEECEDDDEDEDVECGVCVGIDGENIKAQKERTMQRLGDPRRPT